MNESTEPDFRGLAAYLANAAEMLARAVDDATATDVVRGRVEVVRAVLEQWRLAERAARWNETERGAGRRLDAGLEAAATEAPEPVDPRGGPGWPGPCPDGMAWDRWLAANNLD